MQCEKNIKDTIQLVKASLDSNNLYKNFHKNCKDFLVSDLEYRIKRCGCSAKFNNLDIFDAHTQRPVIWNHRTYNFSNNCNDKNSKNSMDIENDIEGSVVRFVVESIWKNGCERVADDNQYIYDAIKTKVNELHYDSKQKQKEIKDRKKSLI